MRIVVLYMYITFTLHIDPLATDSALNSTELYFELDFFKTIAVLFLVEGYIKAESWQTLHSGSLQPTEMSAVKTKGTGTKLGRS